MLVAFGGVTPPPPGRVSEGGGGSLWGRLSPDCAPLWRSLVAAWGVHPPPERVSEGGASFLKLSVYTLGGSEGILRAVGASVARFRHLGGLPQGRLFPYRFLYRSAISGLGASVARF